MTKSKHTALIATWTHGQDLTTDLPRTLRWTDGRPATLQDYITHALDTHILVSRPSEMELRMYPEIVADVRFSPTDGRWLMTGDEMAPIALDLTDAKATDEQIIAEVFTYSIVYRIRIHR